MVAHSCNPCTETEERHFKFSLGYIVRVYLKATTTKTIKQAQLSGIRGGGRLAWQHGPRWTLLWRPFSFRGSFVENLPNTPASLSCQQPVIQTQKFIIPLIIVDLSAIRHIHFVYTWPTPETSDTSSTKRVLDCAVFFSPCESSFGNHIPQFWISHCWDHIQF